MPIVSIVIPTYNSSRYIGETISSILSQTFPDFEIIVVDDCSNDNTQDLIESIHDPRIKYIKLNRNHGGPSKPRNVGIKSSTGKYICFFDSDDIMMPNKLEKCIKFLNERSDIKFVFTDSYKIYENGNLYSETLLKKYSLLNENKNKIKDDFWMLSSSKAFSILFYENYIPTSSVILEKSVLDDVGLLDETLLNSDDRDLWYRITRKYDLGFVDLPLHKYRVRGSSVSKRGVVTALNRIKVLEKQLCEDLSKDLICQARSLISKNYSGIGYIYKKSKNYRESINSYRKSLYFKLNFNAFKSIFLVYILLFLFNLRKRGLGE